MQAYEMPMGYDRSDDMKNPGETVQRESSGRLMDEVLDQLLQPKEENSTVKDDQTQSNSASSQENFQPEEEDDPEVEAAPEDVLEVQAQKDNGLNPKFKDVSLEKLMELARRSENLNEGKELYEEVIKRHDLVFNKDAVKQSKESIAILTRALQEGKGIVRGADGRPAIADEPLNNETRFAFHTAVVRDLQFMSEQVAVRQEFAMFMRHHKQFKDSERLTLEARERADALPIDEMKLEIKQLAKDVLMEPNAEKRQMMQAAALFLNGDNSDNGAIKLPINTRKVLAQLYLGTEVTVKDGVAKVEFGKNSGFKPDKAFEVSKEVREKTQEILGFDPLAPEHQARNPHAAALFGANLEIFANPQKFDLFRLVDANQVESITKELRSSSAAESILLDIGVVAFVALTLAMSRNERVVAAAERVLGKSAPAVSKIGGYAIAGAGAPLLRHYGYEALTGVPETWTDSAVHVVGSLAAAEVGSRILGRGSIILQTGGRTPAPLLREMDRGTAAAWYSSQGFETTGKFADFLGANGLSTEAKAFDALAANTPLTSEAGVAAIGEAGLAHAKVSQVARIIANDFVKSATGAGADHAKVAQMLGQLGEGGVITVGDLTRFIERDVKALEELARITRELPNNTSLAAALSGVPPAKASTIMETIARMGLNTVGEARMALGKPVSLERLFPKINDLLKNGTITEAEGLFNLTKRGPNMFEGPGYDRLIGHLTTFDRGALFAGDSLDRLRRVADRGAIQRVVGEQSNLYEQIGSRKLTHGGSEWATKLLGTGSAAFTYNSVVRAWDYQKLTINPATGAKYTPWEAFKEANLPTIETGVHPYLDGALSVLAGTPGQALLGSMLFRQSPLTTAFEFSKSQIPARSLIGNPLSNWSKWGTGISNRPGPGGVYLFGEVLLDPFAEAVIINSPKKRQYADLLKESQKPIENEPQKDK